jgi:2-methylcitrate dehydratase PrpD
VASALTAGSCWREQYTEEKIRDANVLTLARKVEVVKDDELDALYDEKWPAIVEVQTKDGRFLSARRDIMKGEPEDPVSDPELRRKFDSLTGDAVSADRAGKIWQAVFRLEELKNLSALAGLLRTEK